MFAPSGGSDPGSASPFGQSPPHGAAGYLDVPAPPSTREPLWCEQPAGAPPAPAEPRRRVFCNRSLNMRDVRAVGWDMDYTLAQYKPKAFEEMAYAATVDKLVRAYGYPSALRALPPFDWSYMARGLVIDKARGNVIKLDRHKFVKIAHHGFRRLPSPERDAIYNTGAAARDEYGGAGYAMVDTLFSLAESFLFCQLVEMADADPSSLPHGRDYERMWRDVRSAVDLCHRDGTLKRAIAAAPGKFLHPDPNLVPMLRMLKASGRKLFLATNSLWDYTNVVMPYLCSGQVGRQRTDDWLRLFDVVVVGCAKPGFFTERRPLFAVDPLDGSLRNTDGGAPIIPIGADDLPSDGVASTARALHIAADDKAAVFQGGHYTDLHALLGVKSGAEVLYVGDHIFGDILRSKRSLGWRTMLVVPELELELECEARLANAQAELRALRAERDALADAVQRLEWRLHGGGGRGDSSDGGGGGGSPGGGIDIGGIAISGASNGNAAPNGAAAAGVNGLSDAEARELRARIEELRARRAALKGRHSEKLRGYHEAFHSTWGRLLKTGHQNSLYGHLIDRFCCLYTAHVANLAAYAPDCVFRGRVDALAHEL